MGPGRWDVPQVATQAAVCCLRAATTGLEAWHYQLDPEQHCSKRLMSMLRRRPMVIVHVMDAILKAGENHQRDFVSLTTVHPLATALDVCRNAPELRSESEFVAGRHVAVAGMEEVLQEVAYLQADVAEVGPAGHLDVRLSP